MDLAPSQGPNVRIVFHLTRVSKANDGIEVFDDVSLSEALTISNQSIGVANTSQGFDGVDGILGLGKSNLSTSKNIKLIHKQDPLI